VTAPDPEELERRRTFVDGLGREERVLVLLRDELYEGAWDALEADLRARLERRPAVFKLSTRIEEDLERIAKLREFERTRGVDLRELLPAPPTGGADDPPGSPREDEGT
jgi:hypothetical protein